MTGQFTLHTTSQWK